MSPTDPILSAIQTLEHNLVERLTSEMDRRFSDFRVEVNGRFDAIEKRLDHLEIEYQMMVSGLKRIEERLESDAADRSGSGPKSAACARRWPTWTAESRKSKPT